MADLPRTNFTPCTTIKNEADLCNLALPMAMKIGNAHFKCTDKADDFAIFAIERLLSACRRGTIKYLEFDAPQINKYIQKWLNLRLLDYNRIESRQPSTVSYQDFDGIASLDSNDRAKLVDNRLKNHSWGV